MIRVIVLCILINIATAQQYCPPCRCPPQRCPPTYCPPQRCPPPNCPPTNCNIWKTTSDSTNISILNSKKSGSYTTWSSQVPILSLIFTINILNH